MHERTSPEFEKVSLRLYYYSCDAADVILLSSSYHREIRESSRDVEPSSNSRVCMRAFDSAAMYADSPFPILVECVASVSRQLDAIQLGLLIRHSPSPAAIRSHSSSTSKTDRPSTFGLGSANAWTSASPTTIQ